MTPEERGHVLVTARLLRAVAVVPWLAAALIVASVLQRSWIAPLLGLIALYYGVRVAFDARLFDDILAERITTEQMDAALGARRSRDWVDRSRGARRLVVKAMIAVALQVALIIWGQVAPLVIPSVARDLGGVRRDARGSISRRPPPRSLATLGMTVQP